MTSGGGIAPRKSLAAVMLLQFGIGGAILPFIFLMLRDRGLEVVEISRIFLAASSTLLVFPFLWGMLGDRLIPLNRLFAVVNLLALMALAAFWRQTSYMGWLLAFTLFYACLLPTFMLVNTLCFRHLEHPGEEFAPLRAWGSLGWILPSVPIFMVLWLSPGGSLDFILILAMGLACASFLATFALPDTPPGAKAGPGTAPRQLAYWPAMRRLLRNTDYLILLGSFFLMSASFSIQAFYSPPRLEDLGMSRAWIGPVQAGGVVLEIFLFRWRSAIVRRLSYRGSVVMGCAALSLRQVLFATVDHLGVLALSYFLIGFVVVFYHTGVSLLIERIAGIEVKATAQTLLVLCGSGLGPMFANWAVGWLGAGPARDLSTVFWFAALLPALAGVLIAAQGRSLLPKVRGGGASRE